MDIFRKMKKGLGLDSEQKKGNVLGSAPASITYSSTFTEAGSIGISVENRSNLPVVVRVESKSAAFSAGVIVGDIVVGLNDYEINSYEEFFEIYATLERPLIVRYEYCCDFSFVFWFIYIDFVVNRLQVMEVLLHPPQHFHQKKQQRDERLWFVPRRRGKQRGVRK